MWSFPPKYLPIISARQVALRIGQENLFWGQKIQNWLHFFQISWNLGWRSLIKYYSGPKKLRPKFGVYHTFCDALVPSLTLPSGTWFAPCKHDFVPNNGSSCALACSFPCWPSPKNSQDEYWPSQSKSLYQPQSPVQWMSSWFGFFGKLAGSHGYFATPW